MKDTIKGFVKNYVYRNAENNFSIVRVVDSEYQTHTVTGSFPVLTEDFEYEFSGQFMTHPTYGKQLKVETFKKLEIQSETGIVSYLSSSLFTGIGPKTATKIVEHLGVGAIKLILADPKVLIPLKFTEFKYKKLHEQLQFYQQQEGMLIKLFELGLTTNTANKLISQYGEQTLEKINEDPFRLVDEVIGFGFIKSLEVANRLGITNDDARTLSAAIVYILANGASKKGDLYMHESTLSNEVYELLDVKNDLNKIFQNLVKSGRLIKEGQNYFLIQSYYAEVAIAEKIKLLNQHQVEINDELESLISIVEKKIKINYTDLQKEAIITSLSNQVSIITGGPGTGKTTIIKGILLMYGYLNKLDLKDDTAKSKIALMAPTGRAAKRMKELLKMPAKTIHSTLGFDFEGGFTYNRNNQLTQDLIIIDEASMIDAFLAKRLFDAIKEKAQVIIVGDKDQLPSVGPGNVLADLITSSKVTTIKLNQIHRQASGSKIIQLANQVNQQTVKPSDLKSGQEVFYLSGPIHTIKASIIKRVEGAINHGYSLQDDIQILIPLYKGDLGIDAINSLIQENFNPYFNSEMKMTYQDKVFYQGDKVIQLVNDKDRQIMNGDIGRITKISRDYDGTPFMRVIFDDNEVMYTQSDLAELNLAYAVSIHKSQGSEYKVVFLPIIKSYLHMLKKELIYTAITRTKEYLFILGDLDLLSYASNQLSESRKTMLSQRLNEDLVELEQEDTISPYDFM